jgi:hypothetical protein
MAASRWQRSGWLTSALGKMGEKGEASADVSFYREGEREREEATVVPHVGVRTPAACQTGWTTPRCQAPIPGL